MTPSQIEGMIDRIVGIFPAHNVSRNTMKATWGQDTYLLSLDVDDARKVIDLVEQHGRIPSLPEIKAMFGQLFNANRKVVFTACDICDGNGWDTGWRITQLTDVESLHASFYTETHLGKTYTVVKRCACGN